MLSIHRASKDDLGHLGDVVVAYGLNELLLDGGQYEFRRVKLTEASAFFDVINDYWRDTLTPTQEDHIFANYKTVYDLLEKGCELEVLEQAVDTACTVILESVDFHNVRRWLVRSSKYILPSSLREAGNMVYNQGSDKPAFIEIIGDDGSSTYQNIETTYTKEDYLTLAALVIQLKPLLPIISAYVSLFESKDEKIEKGMTVLLNTPLMASQEESNQTDGGYSYINPAIEKMYLHIASLRKCAFASPGSSKAAGANDISINVGLDGLSTEEIDDWLFSVVMTTKLMLGEISTRDGNINIISSVYKSVNASIQTLQKKGGFIASVENLGYSEESSTYERFSGKVTVTDGDVAIANRYTSSVPRMLRSLLDEVDLDDDLIEMCTKHVRTRIANAFAMGGYHFSLVRYVCGKYVSPKVMLKLSHDSIVNCYIATMYYLITKGFSVLAILMFADINEAMESDNSFGRSRLQNKLPKEVQTQLDELYPHKLRRGKTVVSLAAMDIDTLFGYLNGKAFSINACDELFDIVAKSEYPLIKSGALYSVAPRVKTLIAILMIDLGSR